MEASNQTEPLRSRNRMLKVVNPASGQPIAELSVATKDDVQAAVKRLRQAQPQWQALSYRGRYQALKELRYFLLDNQAEFTDRLVEETGKVRTDAANEALYLADAIDYYGRHAEQFLAEENPKPHSLLMRNKELKVVYRPHPVVGLIGPWNFPVTLALGDSIPAFMAGCAVLIKPSEYTPLTLSWIASIWRQLGLPPVFETVVGAAKTGEALIDNVDYVGFTGSVATGRKVAVRAAKHLKPYSLELGGKDPMLVLADADIKRAAAGAAWGGFANSGQICMSVERIYVEEPAYDQFVNDLVGEVRCLRQGRDNGRHWHEVGAMTTPAQIATVQQHVEDAVAKGARVLTGGKKAELDGDFFEPTVLTDVDHTMDVMRQETFGPVLPVMKVRNSEEAIRLANDSDYGLSASVWSSNKKVAEKVARRLEVGSCNVNDVLVNYLTSDVPFGGWKDSGVGYRHGPGGIRKYCKIGSLVITRRTIGKREAIWFPYSKRKAKVFARAASLIYGPRLRERLARRFKN